MTKEQAIELLQSDIRWAKENRYPYISESKVEALQMAIEALEFKAEVEKKLKEDTVRGVSFVTLERKYFKDDK